MRQGRLRGAVAIVIWSVVATAARALDPDDDAVKQAVSKGVRYLRSTQTASGKWPHEQIGATALAGLTLVECGVRRDDPAVAKAAAVVREASLTSNQTYSLALSLMFLDRLRQPEDVPLIESLAVRLIGGQNVNGGWSYSCPHLLEPEVRRLTAHIRADKKLSPAADPPKQPPDEPATAAKSRTLTREIREQLKLIDQLGPAPATIDDNSNTQFAILGLWVAQRHGLPVAKALARAEARFRNTQNFDGGWGYTPGPGVNSSTAMTCAGLLGLAVGVGAREKIRAERQKDDDADDPPPQRGRAKNDPAIRAGLLALGTVIGLPLLDRVGLILPQAQGGLRLDNYFLWSLERVAVAYDLRTIAKKDWYTWGAQQLFATQTPEGCWVGHWGDPSVSTCFALLFLRRANLAEDLTTALRGRVRDPGEVTLRTGGVGGDYLKRIRLIPSNDPDYQVTRGGARKARAAAAADPEVSKLTAALLDAPLARQKDLIATYQEAKGVVYTQALAGAIRGLDGDLKGKARDALAERLVRMSAPTLRVKLGDEDLEVRSAAALACGMRRDEQFVPDLIALLADPDRRVARASHVALKAVAGKDLGPAADAPAEERDKAVAAWKAWWKEYQGR